MSSGIDELRKEQRRIVVRVTRIVAIGALLGAVFFLYTELVMNMEQTRQWLLSDVPRDEKVARALGEILPDASCPDVTAELDAARAANAAAVADCHKEHAAFAASAASSDEAYRTALQALETEATEQQAIIAQRDAQIVQLREELYAANSQLVSVETAPESEDPGVIERLRRLSKSLSSTRKFKVDASKAYFDEDSGLSVSLREVSGDFSVDVRIEAPGLGASTDEMSPGEQRTFTQGQIRYALVLLESDPNGGVAEFSLVGKPVQ